MKESIQAAIAEVVQKLFGQELSVELTRPEEQFGDFATNVAMQLAGKLQKNPREIAELIAKNLHLESSVREASVAGPGFINVFITDETLIQSLVDEPTKLLAGKKVLVEYSDPNPFKPLHAGHLYTTLVGDVLARLVENAGAETVRLNFGGDVGMHVGKTMWAVVKELGGEEVDKVKSFPVETLGLWMGQRYVEGNNAFDNDEEAQAEIKLVNKKVYALHSGNDRESDFAQIYWYLRDQSYEFFKNLYKDLQVIEFDRFIPESEVAQLGLNEVKKHVGDVFQESDGAIVFEGESYGLHTRVFINNEGLPTYEAKDVGLSLTKWRDYTADESIIITAAEQAQYMQVVIKSIEQFEPEAARRTKHLTHGMVKLAGGVKMSSRKGNILSAFDILQAARMAGKESGQADNEEVMLASVKYALLKNRIGGDIIYDPKESIATEGNSGPYLQYAHARACSILAKSAAQEVEITDVDEAEKSLVRKLTQYAETIDLATTELAPHHICTYLYELAQTFNRFYENVKVVGHEREQQRISLVTKYAETLKKGLNLLGIHAPEQM